MHFRLVAALAVAGLGFTASPGGTCTAETNLWPLYVSQPADATGTVRWSSLGPLVYGSRNATGESFTGIRPFADSTANTRTEQTSGSLLYPIFHWQREATIGNRTWSIFNIVNATRTPSAQTDGFDAWPFYFSRHTTDPASSYRAVFPLLGDVPQRFGQDRMRWVLFPLYGRFEKRGEITTTTPWPFVKIVSGEGFRGFELWPLGGHREQTGVTSDSFLLWPLIYRHQSGLDTATPTINTGILPFYALDRSPGYVSETYAWPFFGYVDRTEPYRYHATHYFWPFWVQGHGDQRRINRWAPFYSHSEVKGQDKTWLMWPLWRQLTWDDTGLKHERQQLLYFVYNATKQSSLTQPHAAPATKVHLWPLFSAWDNGAGRKQVQALSPFDVFFPNNEHVRRLWSPLFAVYRFNQTAPGEVRYSWFWDAVTFTRSKAQATREFNLGPIVGYSATPDRQRVRFLAGLVGFHRNSGQRFWRPYFGGERDRDDPPPPPPSLP